MADRGPARPPSVPLVAWRACASPIERAMLVALLDLRPGATVAMVDADVVPQAECAGGRADFLVGGVVAVECDGTEFHRRPEVANRDRELDRRRTRQGYVVLRYSGAEIWRQPRACAREAWEVCDVHRR